MPRQSLTAFNMNIFRFSYFFTSSSLTIFNKQGNSVDNRIPIKVFPAGFTRLLWTSRGGSFQYQLPRWNDLALDGCGIYTNSDSGQRTQDVQVLVLISINLIDNWIWFMIWQVSVPVRFIESIETLQSMVHKSKYEVTSLLRTESMFWIKWAILWRFFYANWSIYDEIRWSKEGILTWK